MAAATVTRAITSTVHTITVTGTGGAGNTSSIAQVYTAVVAKQSTAMSYDAGTSTYTLHRLTATYAYFVINGNCTVQIPENTTFYSEGYPTLTATNTIFSLLTGGTLICRPGSKIKFSSGGGIISFVGDIQAIGTQANPVIFQQYRLIYCNHTMLGINPRYQWVTFKNCSYSLGSFLQFTQYSQARAVPITFRNVKFTNDNPANKWGYPFNFTPGGMYANVDIDGFQCVYTNTILIYGCSAKLKNGIIKNSAAPNITIQGGGNVISVGYQTSKNDNTFPTGRFQSMVVLQTIQFDNLASASTYAISGYYNSVIYVKNCKFSATNGIKYRALDSGYGSVILQNNNDITALLSNSSRKSWVANGTILHGHQLDLTVLDQNNQPVNEATVTVIQKSNPSKQRWSGLTKQNGKLLTVYNDNPVYIQKQQQALNNFVNWSTDIDAGLYHILTISKEGYKLYIQTIEFISDITRVVNLEVVDNLEVEQITSDTPGIQIGEGIAL